MQFGNFSLGYNNRDSFIRFTNVTIPQGATITNAYVRFTAVNSLSGAPCTLQLAFEDSANAIAPINISQLSNIINWYLTPSKPLWTVGTTTAGSTFDTPDIKSSLQTVIDRALWASGNALNFTLKNTNSGGDSTYRNAKTYESGSGYAQLHVEWKT
jgi:hypothetical protein